jgi:hypothetical protein
MCISSIIKCYKHTVICFLVALPISIIAQNTQTVQQIWLGYFANAQISKKLSISTDIHCRTKDNFTQQTSTIAIRPAINYHFSNQLFATVGYAFFAFPNTNSYILENRSWQQLQWQQPLKKSRLTHRLRIEQRFRDTYIDRQPTQHNFNHRFRYLLGYQLPLHKKGIAANTFSAFVSNEIHVNAGKESTLNTFDQNRFFIGFQYHVSTNTSFQLGFMPVHQQLQGYKQFRNIETIRLFVVQGFNLANF